MSAVKVPEPFKQSVMKDILLPDYQHDIKATIEGKNTWKKVAQVLLCATTLLTGLSGIFSFLNLQFQSPYINMTSGILATTSIILKQYASFAETQQEKKTNEINQILAHVGIDFNFVEHSEAV